MTATFIFIMTIIGTWRFIRGRNHTAFSGLPEALTGSRHTRTVTWRFIKHKARATPQEVQLGLARARAKARPGERPMV